MTALSSASDRRSFMKWAAALPLLGQIAAQDLLGKLQGAVGKTPAENVYHRLGVRTLINCRGTWTYLSGSLELPEVRTAQLEAAKHFVDIMELQQAAAMASATAACLAGNEPTKIWQLPDTTGLKHAVVMVGGRSAFDSAIRLAGAELVLVYSREELKNALSANTAMIYTTDLGEDLAKEIAIAKYAKVPLLLDDAAGIPPIENIKLYAKMGADLYTFSGGKGLMGPQCSGLLLGRIDLVQAALANTNPWEGAICRPMKVGKEEIIGCLAALETWLKNALNREWNRRIERIAQLVETVPGVKTEIQIPKEGNRYPTLTVSWEEQAWGFSVADCARKLSEGDPRIEVLTKSNPSLVPAVVEGNPNRKEPKGKDQLQIVSMTLRPSEEIIVGRCLRGILNAARKGAQQGA